MGMMGGLGVLSLVGDLGLGGLLICFRPCFWDLSPDSATML